MSGVISVSQLESGLVDNWVACDVDGNLDPSAVVTNHGPAVILVREVTDAMKIVSDDVVADAVDRSRMGSVAGFVLNRAILKHLSGSLTAQSLIAAVREAGFVWDLAEYG